MPDPAPSEALLLIENPAEGVLLLRLNRPERRNALSTPLLTEIARALTVANTDPAVRAVVITGNPKVFAAGADIDELAQSTSGDAIDSPRYLAWQAVRSFSRPLIAAVEGWCLGAGMELLMCCDIAIGGAEARFGQPETNLGIMPGAGGTATLARLVGRARAMHMVLLGEPIAAATAMDYGLIAEVTATGEALDRALAIGNIIAGRPPLALSEAKASIRDAELLTECDHIVAERTRFVSLLSSADKAEGIAAFREKRLPVWTGR